MFPTFSYLNLGFKVRRGLSDWDNTNAFYDGLVIHAQIVEDGFDGQGCWLYVEYGLQYMRN